MNQQQADQAREHAYSEAALGLRNLPSYELGPDGTRAAGVLLNLQQRIRSIEAAEAARDAAKHAPPQTDDGRIADAMQDMAARGLGRV